uniref:Uncharacterized protein n=1 Tax=viral metagenome TaxID=1070528 RepID=A0A6M3K1U7_9ZZZZ
MSDTMSWDEVEVDPEEVTDQDAKAIEEGVGEYPPIGLYLCRVIESTPKRIDFNAYSCLGTTLKFEVERALEIEAKPVEGDEGEVYEGKHIYDDVAFAHEKEKDGMKKRRKYVALRLGIINPGQVLRKDLWRDDVIGKRVILRLVENKYKDKKTGEEKIGRPQVGFFDGYHYADKSNQVAEVEKWDDI